MKRWIGGRFVAPSLVAVLSLTASSGVAAAPMYTVVGMGADTWSAVDVNNLGQVVGEIGVPNGQRQAYLWDPVAGRTTFTFDNVRAINDAGQIVGSRGGPYIWDRVNGFRRPIPHLGSGGANDINASGQIAGAVDLWAYVWDPVTGARTLGTFAGNPAGAVGMNDLGQVVGRTRDANQRDRAFLWDPVSRMRDLGTIDMWSAAAAVNNHGLVVGRTFGDGEQAIVWDAAHGMRVISGASRNAVASAVNNAGEVVGTVGVNAFIWDEASGLRTLDSLVDPSSRWELQQASAISDTGYIVGYGHHDGLPEAFLLVPIQPPTVAPLPPAVRMAAATGFAAVARSRRARRRRSTPAPAPLSK